MNAIASRRAELVKGLQRELAEKHARDKARDTEKADEIRKSGDASAAAKFLSDAGSPHRDPG